MIKILLQWTIKSDNETRESQTKGMNGNTEVLYTDGWLLLTEDFLKLCLHVFRCNKLHQIISEQLF